MAELHVINGRQMSFLDEGAGEPLALLHAFPLQSAMWKRQLKGLARKHRVVCPDLPGFGASEVVSGSSSPMDRMGDSVAVLLETLRIGRAVVGGCSMGGYVALALARRYPNLVRGLVLTNSRANADTEEGRANREKTAQAVMKRGLIEVEETLGPKLLGPNASPEVREEVLAMIRAASKVGTAAASRGMAGRLDNREWLSRCACPVLVIAGDADQVIPRAESEEMARIAPKGELVVLPGAGHLAPMEQPEAWNAAVEAWMAKLPR